MGWTSGADPQNSVTMTFDTKEDAIFFAKKNGWKYEVKAPTQHRMIRPGTFSYADNFLPRPVNSIIN
jgi:NADH dehydrogenase (ubiquinone) Fe-S protein 4